MALTQKYEEKQIYRVPMSNLSNMVKLYTDNLVKGGWSSDETAVLTGDCLQCRLTCDVGLDVKLEPRSMLARMAAGVAGYNSQPFPKEATVTYRFEFDITGESIGAAETRLTARIEETIDPHRDAPKLQDGTFEVPSQREFLIETVHSLHSLFRQALQ